MNKKKEYTVLYKREYKTLYYSRLGIGEINYNEGRIECTVDKVYHRDDGEPAIIYPNGTLEWYYDGLLHRDNGPAVIEQAGILYWYKEDLMHRQDGPAYIDPVNDIREWWIHGDLIKTEC